MAVVSFIRGSDFNNAVAKGDCDRMSPVEGPELSNGVVDMLVDSSLDDMENFADLPGGHTLRHQRQNVTLTRREQ